MPVSATTYATMGVEFDKLYLRERHLPHGKGARPRGRWSSGVFERTVRTGPSGPTSPNDGLDRKAPASRQDGTTAVYMTQDIGTALLRFQDCPDLDRQVYTVGNEQEYHFKVLFLMVSGQAGLSRRPSSCHHLSYGMVELPEGKMKSREGTVVDADDLMRRDVRISPGTSPEEAGKLGGAE